MAGHAYLWTEETWEKGRGRETQEMESVLIRGFQRNRTNRWCAVTRGYLLDWLTGPTGWQSQKTSSSSCYDCELAVLVGILIVGVGLSLNLLPAFETLFLLLVFLIQLWCEGLCLVLLHFVMLCSIAILGRTSPFWREAEWIWGRGETGS